MADAGTEKVVLLLIQELQLASGFDHLQNMCLRRCVVNAMHTSTLPDRNFEKAMYLMPCHRTLIHICSLHQRFTTNCHVERDKCTPNAALARARRSVKGRDEKSTRGDAKILSSGKQAKNENATMHFAFEMQECSAGMRDIVNITISY